MRTIASSRGIVLAFGLPFMVMFASSAIANGPPSSSPIKARKLMEKIDADRDGRISLTEWRLQSMPQANFESLDRDKNGIVTLRELRAPPPPALDATRDGKLSPREMTFGKSAPKVNSGAGSKRR